MRLFAAWPAVFLIGLASAVLLKAPGSSATLVSAQTTTEAFLGLEAASWDISRAVATIRVQIGDLHGSAVVLLFGQTTPSAHTIEGQAFPSTVGDLIPQKTVCAASCSTAADQVSAFRTASPASTEGSAMTVGSSMTVGSCSFVNATGDATTRPFFVNSTINPTTFNATTFNATTFNATTFNATTFNATTGSLPHRPFPTQMPTAISLFSSGVSPTRNGAGKVLLAALLQVSFVGMM